MASYRAEGPSSLDAVVDALSRFSHQAHSKGGAASWQWVRAGHSDPCAVLFGRQIYGAGDSLRDTGAWVLAVFI